MPSSAICSVDVVDQDQDADVDDLVSGGELRAGRERRATIGRSQRGHARHPLRRGDRGGLHPARPRARHRCGQAAADRHLLQQAVFSRPATSRRAALAAGGFGRAPPILPASSGRRAMRPGPLVVEQYVLTNPALNYAQFLLRAILPTVLHIVIAIAGGYAVGSEFGSRNLRRMAGGGRRRSADRAGRQARRLTSASSCCLMVVARLIIHRAYRGAVPRRSVLRRRRRLPADRGLSVARRAAPAARAQPRFRPQPDRHLLLARLRLRRRRLSGAGDGRLRAGLGLHCCRCAGTSRSLSDQARARRAGRRFARAVCRCWPALALVYLRPRRLRLRSIARKPAAGAGGNPRRGRHGPASSAPLSTEYRGASCATAAPSACSCWRPSSMASFYPAALSRPAGSRRADRRRRRRLIRGQPDHHPGPERHEARAGGACADARWPKRRRRWPRREVFAIVDIPAGTEREVLAGRQARAAGLCRFRLLPALQPNAPGHPRGDGAVTAELAVARRAAGRQPRIARRWRRALRWRS